MSAPRRRETRTWPESQRKVSHQSLSHRKDRPRGQGLKVTAIRCLYTFRNSGESVDEPAGMGPHPRVWLCLPILYSISSMMYASIRSPPTQDSY